MVSSFSVRSTVYEVLRQASQQHLLTHYLDPNSRLLPRNAYPGPPSKTRFLCHVLLELSSFFPMLSHTVAASYLWLFELKFIKIK